jgi:ParB-like chromosome segregation protein Spo0J
MSKQISNKVEYRSLSELKELEGNPRTITKDKMNKLVDSIKANQDYFEARPVICSDRTGELVILAGNQRFKAAKIAGLTEVPVVVLHGLDEEREKELIIRDNVELGDWDMDILANEWDIELLKMCGVDEVLKWDETEENFVDLDETNFLIEIHCENENQQQELFEELKNRGLECKIS